MNGQQLDEIDVLRSIYGADAIGPCECATDESCALT